MSTSSLRLLLLCCCVLSGAVRAATDASARKPARSTAKTAAATDINPEAFRSTVVIDAATGKVLFEAGADVQNPPASVTKLMTFAVIQDKLQRGELTLQNPVTIAAEAAKMGGSEAWLVHNEKVSVEELLYLLMVQSANDAAVALAIHTTGSKEAFVELMNAKARELGMTHTEFHSPHGLPPGKGQEADVSTARDIALLSRQLIAKTDILRYTSTRTHEFHHANGVVNNFINHNHLLGLVPGCDGLKTGWYAKAGYSLATTVQRNGRRIIVVVLGSPERKGRDTLTTQLVERGFAALPPVVSQPPLAGATAGVFPATLPVHAAAPTPLPPSPPPSSAAQAQTGDTATSLKLVPLNPDERNQLIGGPAEPDVTVHVAMPPAPKK
jgi:D-alanyl-D-alanine carboxypeptidase (penicillin-binding protein 5/6)